MLLAVRRTCKFVLQNGQVTNSLWPSGTGKRPPQDGQARRVMGESVIGGCG
jgi:hypothetical protein